MARDLDQERRWVAEAAQYAQYVTEPDGIAEAFSTYRELRTNADAPWRDVKQRNFAIEAMALAASVTAYASLSEYMRVDL
jgi:hypothetical protein